MARQKLEDRKVRKINKTGKEGSYYATLPIELMRKVELERWTKGYSKKV